MTNTSYKRLNPPVKLYAPVSNFFSIATIFKPLKRGEQRVPFQWTRETPTYTLDITGWETLDAFDLDVLLAILHLAGKQVKELPGSNQDVLELQATGEVHPSHFDTCYATFTRYELLTLLHKSCSTPNYDALKASLIRLSKVQFKLEYKKYDQWMTSNLLSATGLDNKCKVVLNRELGYGLVQNHAKIWLHERENLSEAGRILHTYLSGAIREGGTSFVKFKVDTMVEQVYNVNIQDIDRKSLCKYRHTITTQAKLLLQIWQGSEVHEAPKTGDTCFLFKRPLIT
jgi:hypothetical protein